ncbi:AAA family ATPase [Flavobacterium sp. Arc2]|uniref:AAA family ATPase n=1 Tax=Flavobacterium sp. Arc2 TaxID=3046685 RepID=UPI00352F0FBA
MIKIHSIKALVTDTSGNNFGFDYIFSSGLNILSGDNSSGKSTVLSCIYYCLGMEQLASYGNSDGLKECLKTSFKYNNQNFSVFESYAQLNISNEKGEVAIIKRVIKSPYTEDTNLINVQVNDGLAEEKFIHAAGDTDHADGFYRWLSDFSNIAIPLFADEDGTTQKILYLQQIFASSFVEQTKGWSDFFAQIPVFNTKKAKQKIVEYTLGLSGLIEEFELDKLKQREKEYKTVWTNTVETFQTITSYYNLLTANLAETFTAELSPAKILKLDLQTRDTKGNYSTLNKIISDLMIQDRDLALKNTLDTSKITSSEILIKHNDTSKKLVYLNKELQKVRDEQINEEVKIKNYQITVEHLNREIEALEGINKLNQLKSFHVGAVENCPVCNSSLLTNPDIQFTNIDKINSSKSIYFYKSERSLYESYLKSSQNLNGRFDKIVTYYHEKIRELKNILSMLDQELLDDSRIPSRISISEEMRIKFELEKMVKIGHQFNRFKSDLTEISKKLAKIRSRKEVLKRHFELDQEKIKDFKNQFIKYLEKFGYSKEILSRIYISQDESNKLFPVVNVGTITAQPIRLLSSASDFIRAQWAFYMTLLVKAELHLGILILDEPGQHAIASADLQELLKEASKNKDRQILVAISKEDKITTSENGQTMQVEVDLLNILKETKLIKNQDYTINIIDSHNRKDKCIQPL